MSRVINLSLFILIYLMIPSYGSSDSYKDNKSGLFKNFSYRNIGPFRTGAWISDIAVPENPSKKDIFTFYIASRNGGVWKTVNNGTTFYPIFDNYGVNSIGSIEIAPLDSKIVWVGTGDDSNARSSYHGNGIYKSTDSGKTFTNMGLTDSHHIGKIIIHPTDPNIVYVAVMGHLFSKNSERGVFKTIDGGENWEKILFINDGTGISDICMNFQNPDIIFAASYEKQRLPWHFEAGGENSRIYRTTDGGKSWKMLTNGLPNGKLGRIGIDICRSVPNTIYAVIQNLNPKSNPNKKKETIFDPLTDHSYDKLVGGEVYRSDNNGDTWGKVNPSEVDVSGKAAYSFNEIYVDPINPENLYIISDQMLYSENGGRNWPGWKKWKERTLFKNNFGDIRTFWIDPKNPNHMLLGSDGGVYSSWDGGKTMFHHYNIPLGEVYDVETDNDEPYNVYIGLQDHETWKGPSNGWSGSVGLEDWIITGMWDGMYTTVDPKNNRWLYFTTQFGKHHRVDQYLGKRVEITPKRKSGKPPYRYTWTTPIALSPHDSKVVYTGGQMLLRSLDRGTSWKEISPDLTLNNPEKIAGKGHIMYCTITTISESPLRVGLVWVGTDDGKVHVTNDNGLHWRNRTSNLIRSGGPEGKWVSRIVASSHNPYGAYIVQSGFREDDFQAYVFKTDNMGRTWKNISENLPDTPVSVIVEDNINKSLLFVGTDSGVFFTFNGGKNWIRLKNNMPPVPVKDIVIHKATGDMIVGTYGRGTWITNIAPLRELSERMLREPIYLFNISPRPVMISSERAWWGNYEMTGDAHLRTLNEKSGLNIYYYIKRKILQHPKLTITNLKGEKIQTVELERERGIHKLNWISLDKRPGKYNFTLKSGEKEITKKGILKQAVVWSFSKK